MMMSNSIVSSNIIRKVRSLNAYSAFGRGPEAIYWDITYRCNMKCSHCLNNGGDSNCNDFSQELSDDEAYAVVDQLVSMRPHSLCICGGEPLLRYNIVKHILKEMKRINVSVNMVSNGILINEAIVTELKELGIGNIQISLDGLGWQHDIFRNQIGAFEQAINAIKILKQHGVDTTLSFCPNKYNYSSFLQYVEFVNSLNCNSIRMMPLTPIGRGGTNYQDLKLTERESYNFVQKIHTANDLFPKMSISWGDPLNYMYRFLINRRITPMVLGILSNGDLTVTPYLNITVGNVRKHNLKDYWYNGINKAYGNDIIVNTIKKCITLEDLLRYSDENRTIDMLENK